MSKRKRPKEAVFDDEKELELEHIARSFDPDAPDVLTGMDSGTASANECTGLIPNGGDLPADDFELHKDLFPFSAPKDLSL